jgi:hypothetical protein
LTTERVFELQQCVIWDRKSWQFTIDKTIYEITLSLCPVRQNIYRELFALNKYILFIIYSTIKRKLRRYNIVPCHLLKAFKSPICNVLPKTEKIIIKVTPLVKDVFWSFHILI